MKPATLALIPAILLVTACGPKAITLPEDPVELAATCSVVEAASARLGQAAAVAKPLPFATQGRIIHYAMLSASEGKAFDTARAAAVVKRMPQLADAVTAKRWKTLVDPCHAAFPATALTPTALPADPLTAGLGCDELANFLKTALAQQDVTFAGELAAYDKVNDALDSKDASLLVKRGIMSLDARTKLRGEAMATMTKLGSPMAVMKLCVARYA